MTAEDLVRRFASQINIMQLATARDNQPWACTVHYYSDDDLNFYWISTTERKHSLDLVNNSKAAAAIMVHENTVEEPYVIGISIIGTVELIGERVPQEIGEGYIQKLHKPANLLSEIAEGKDPHKFYRLTPSKIVLFDNKNFKDNPRKELELARQ